MMKILTEIHICSSLIPQTYYYQNVPYLVGKSFVIPFSRTVDLEFESIDSLVYYIKEYVSGKKDLSDNPLNYINSFNKKKYLEGFEYTKKNEFLEFGSEINQITKDYIELINKLDLLVIELKKQEN